MFVAIYPPAEIAAVLCEAIGALELPPHRVTPGAQVHMTLQFVGDTRVRDVGSIVESVGCAAAGLTATTLTPQRLIALPARGPARLVAAETDAPPTVLELKRRLALRLAQGAQGARRAPADRFLPHLTLCRFLAPTRLSPRPDVPLSIAPFGVSEVRVMRSVLRPDGARHDEVASIPLG